MIFYVHNFTILVCHIEERVSTSACNTTSSTVQRVFENNFYPNFRFISNFISHVKEQKHTTGM